MSSEISTVIRKLGLVPNDVMVDATEPVTIQPQLADIRHAQRQKKRGCVMARACNRVVEHASGTYTYPTSTWIHRVYKDPKNPKKVIEEFVHYLNSKELEEMIGKYDAGADWIEQPYVLLPPTGSHSRDRVVARSKKRKGRHAASPAPVSKEPKKKIKRRMVASMRTKWEI